MEGFLSRGWSPSLSWCGGTGGVAQRGNSRGASGAPPLAEGERGVPLDQNGISARKTQECMAKT